MHFNSDFIQDLELLQLFSANSTQEGLKIHHEAEPARIASAQRLFDQKLTTLADGGYLTPLGIQAAEHTAALVTILQPKG